MNNPIPPPASEELRAEFKRLWKEHLKQGFLNLAGQNLAAAESIAWAAFRAGRRQ